MTVAILTGAAFFRSLLGFGMALIAMPLLVLTMNVQTATPLVALYGTTIGAIILWRSWREVDLSASWRLVLSSFAGIPAGLWFLKTAPDALVRTVLGVVIILFGLYSLLRPKLIALEQQRWAYAFGAVAGIMGGAYNASGPPIVVYGALRRWSPARFRASVQGYFLPTGLFILAGHGVSGLWTSQVMELYTLAFLPVMIATFLGEKFNRRIPARRFTQILYGVLIILGLLLIR